MTDALSLVSLEHILIKSLCEASQKFSSASSTASRQQGYVDLLNALCEYITNRYPNLVIEESLKPVNAVTNDPLNFLDMHLDLLQREAPLSSDFLRWLITKLVLTTGSVHLSGELIGNIRKYCRDFLSKLLLEEEHMSFVLNIIEQLQEHTKVKTLSLWEVDKAITQCFEADREIDIEKFTAKERENVIATIIELLTTATFPLKELSEYHLCVIWNTTIELFSTGSTSMRTSVLRTWTCLLANDAANYVTCRLAVDRLLQLEVLQKQVAPSFEQTKSAFFEVLQDALINFDERRSMLDIDLKSVIYWGETASSIFLKTPSKREVMLNFARIVCQVLSVADLDEEDVGMLSNLQLSSAKIVSFFFGKYRDNETDVYLEPFVSFLLHTCDPDTKDNWIRYVAEDHVSSSDFEKLILSKMFISVLQRCNSKAARSCLKKLAPTGENIMKFVEDANKRGDFQLLLTLITIIGDLAIADCISSSISLPFLSLPWLSNETILSSATNRRHQQSIPTLRDFTKFASFIKKFPKEKEVEARLSSIVPLTKISKHNEWRRHLYTTAVKDKNPKIAEKALNHLHELLTSIGTASFQIIADAALESGSVTRDVVMSSLARCICILDAKPDSPSLNYNCDICQGSGRQIDLKGKRLESFPESLLRLIMDKMSNPSSTSLGSLKLACALIFHYPHIIPENRLKDTLVFMANCQKAVREQNLHLFKQIVTTSDSPTISQLLQDKLPFYQSKMDDVVLDPFSAKYLTICAMYAKNQELSKWAFGKHYSIILQNQELEFLNSMRNLVRDIASLEDMTTSRVFARRIRTITRELCSHLLSFGKLSTPIGFSESLVEEITSALELTRKIFFFEDLAAMLKIGARYIVPSLLMCSFEERPWTIIVIEKIRESMLISKEQFGHEFFPHFMVQWILQKGPNFTESDSRFIASTCGAPMNQLSSAKRYTITQLLLQFISINQTAVSEGLAKLNASLIGKQSFSITKIMLISCEYVGHFLKLRWCLTVDDFYEQRSILMKSLDLIIQRVEPQFLDDVANRLMSVLRAATQCGEAAIPVWITFAMRLDRNTFKALLPRILIDTQPLLQYDSSDALISVIVSNGGKSKSDFDVGQEAVERENIVSTTFVLIGCDINGSMRLQKYLETMREPDRPLMTPEKLINTCVRLLQAECETVGRVVLQKLHSLLDGNPVKEELSSAVIPALFQTLRRCSDPETRALTVKCLGRLGAVDPGRLDIAYTNSAAETTVFVDDKDNFLVDLIERSWKAYSRETEFAMFEQIEYSIQELLTRVVGRSDEHGILERLSVPCRKDIWPLKSTQLAPRVEPKWTAPSPVVNNVDNFSAWLQQCFVMGANRVRQDPIRHVFRALKWIANTRDTLFTRYILPQLMLRLIIENDTDVLDTYIVEMETVLRHVVECGQSWVQLAAHIVFSILDTLEQFAKYRKNKKKGNSDSDPELNRTLEMLKTVAGKTLADGQLLIVVAAEKCNCFYRALKWCEQYAIPQDGTFERQAYFTLERIYTSLNNVDGVLGAFECLSKSSPPTANERILALEAAGDYHEAMALYALCGPRNEPEMVKCLLRLNQPQLALCTATAAYNQYSNDENMSEILYANQVEAACLLQDWKQLDSLVENRDPLTLGKRTTWGASCASILCAVKRQESDVLTRRLQLAREILVDQLTAMTIEHSDTYTQAYNYITQLHILDEIEDSSAALHLVSKKEQGSSRDLKVTLDKWQARSDNAIQGAASLESILSVRRELLKLYCPADTKTNISQFLIQSCRLARQAGHLQIAWTFLVEAQSLDVNYKDVGMEQARFEFQKGDQQQAISLLTKLLNGRFETMTGLFQKFVLYVESGGRSSDGSADILKMSKEERDSFAEVQLLRAEYMMKAGAVSSPDLYRIYMALRKINVPSEDVFYRIALFCDGMCLLDNTKVRTDLVIVILKTYADALRYGRNHLFHAMPRMLTLWLDFTQKKHEDIISKLPDVGGSTAVSDANQKDKNDIMKMNGEMMGIFRSLDPYYFYKSYPQLISRIEHKSELVFTTLKTMLAELLIKYPHQCLWLSIAVYRSGTYDKDPRQKRCNSIFQVAKTKDKRLEKLIDQYDYISQCLIQIAEKKNNNFGTHNNLGDTYPQLYDYFTKGIMDTECLMGAKERKLSGLRKELPSIMVPLTEMMDYAIPKNVPHQIESFSQIVIDTAPTEQAMGALPEVLIQKFENNYMVLRSMMQPKRLTIRSQDGRIFHIMAKPSDELRKDARFMDVNRMMNSLMRQNPESRRRQLAVRTFTVIPLQSHGGILEWLPNLIGYRHALQPLFDEKIEKKLSDSDWFKNWDNTASTEDKLKKMQHFYKYYPLVMAEWFRREFVDPSSWHSARSNYARSTAVMSMIGFVLGLGDRHGENILLDQKDGCVVHVDFNLIFNKGEQLPVKEIVPFRLTRNMVNGLGPTGVEGVFRKSCEATLKLMRDNKETLHTVIQAFVHDPLLEWQNSKGAQQNRARQKGGPPAAAGELAADAVALIGKRLEGHIVTPEIFKWKFGMTPMSLEGQVNKLIEIATDDRQLVQMYIGWAPFM